MTAPTLQGAPASASDAAKTPGVLWSAWPEDDCDSDPRIDPMAQKVTEWFVGRWPIGADEPECRILIGQGRSAEIVARRIAEKLTSILNTDAIKAAALAPPAVPESVRRLSEAARPLADEARQWDCPRSGTPGLPDSYGIKVPIGRLRALDRALSTPSGRADTPPADQRHLTGADRIRHGDLSAVDAGNCCAGAPLAGGGAAEALRGISDDFMTSERHHPGYVLIPAAKFEKLCVAERALTPTPAPDGPEVSAPPGGGGVVEARKSDAQIVEEVNDVARMVLGIIGTGYAAPEGHKFYAADEKDVRSRRAWDHAVEIYERVTQSEVQDALLAVEDDRILAMSGDELRAELVAEGHDPDALVRQMKQELNGVLRLAADRQRWREEAASWRRVAERLEEEKRVVLKGERERIAKIINPDAFVGLGEPEYYGPDFEKAWRSAGQRAALKKADAILSAPAGAQTAGGEGLSEAARDVLAERRRQVEGEGWTAEHDDRHNERELGLAAACYASAVSPTHLDPKWSLPRAVRLWPWDEAWWKPSSYRRNLVKAGALIVAEIERLDRAAPPSSTATAHDAPEGGQ